MTIRRGVSLYSYQQAQYLDQLVLEDEIREVGTHLDGADGIEIVDEMSLRYPDPGEDFVRQWFSWMEAYGTTPVALDVNMDVLQFRDHVMTHEECAERLKSDLHLAKRLGFTNVRTLSVVPIDVIELALPTAEELDIRLGKEIHQPMTLDGQVVTEVVELAEKTGSKHVGIVPDMGIFQFAPSPVQLGQHARRGAQKTATAAVVELANLLASGRAPFGFVDVSKATAGNLRADFNRFIRTGDVLDAFRETFQGIKSFTDERVENAQPLDYSVVAEAIMFSNTDPELMADLADKIIHIHGKFNYMSEVPGQAGLYEDSTIAYEPALDALKRANWDGYINTEYEGQRYLQDLPREQYMDEVDQVRKHQAMLKRMIG